MSACRFPISRRAPFSVRATPIVYVSMFDPEGPAVMPKNAAAMGEVPLLWIVGVADPMFLHGKDYVFGPGAKHPKSNYVVLASMHLSTPFQSRGKIIEWLKAL